MYFRILGPLEVLATDGRALRLAGHKQRVVLSALLTAANDVVSVDRLVDWLWFERPPRSARTVVQAHVSRLRRTLEPDRPPWATSRMLLRSHRGYLLRIDPNQLDALRFERLLGEGIAAMERGDARAAAHVLADALALWRGAPLADVAAVEAAQATIARLESLRLSATVLRIDADLSLGRHAGLVPQLEELVRTYPLDERLCGQLMLALYRSGRQADALAAYERMRTALAADLAIAPAPTLQRLRTA
ncbi:MAG TPA: AfsR/SARP family transcriptional regulator, partial [Micromonosporaceae bacterium]|nr:AfsR/SARP family transcriptional regulator [Micromonosporaceae bacterium]